MSELGLSHFTTRELIDKKLLVINDGYRAKNSELNSTHGLPFARAGNINDGFLFVGADRLSDEKVSNIGIKVSQPGDVVFTSKGTVGRFAYVKNSTEPFVYSPQLCFWRSTDSNVLDSRYLYYWMHGPQFLNQIDGLKSQTDMAEYVSLRDQRGMSISIPEVQEQRYVVKILGTLDNKIELNRQTNQTLEAMAQALFKSWFVDFDPVIDNALAAGNDIPEPLKARAAARQALGDARKPLPEEIRREFPDGFEFVDEMGWVPKGWKCGVLNDLAHKVTDGSHTSPASVQPHEGLPMASSKDLTPEGINTDSCRFISRKDFEALVANGCSPDVGDVLISKDGSKCGETCCIHYLQSDVVLLSSVAIIRPNESEHSTFINTLLSRKQTVSDLRENYVSGSAIPRIVLRDLKRYPLVIVPKNVMVLWNGQTAPMQYKRVSNVSESSKLRKLRDTLLPKLLSGQLTIPDAEKLVSDAV